MTRKKLSGREWGGARERGEREEERAAAVRWLHLCNWCANCDSLFVSPSGQCVCVSVQEMDGVNC